mgnify:CR=1 FL=1
MGEHTEPGHDLDRLRELFDEWDDREAAAGISKEASMFAVMTHWGRTLDLAMGLREDNRKYLDAVGPLCPKCGKPGFADELKNGTGCEYCYADSLCSRAAPTITIANQAIQHPSKWPDPA